MSYKKIEYGFSFADIAIKAYSDKIEISYFSGKLKIPLTGNPFRTS